ncbi:MAG TPA: hypothetical protein VFD23_06750, partial [Clostridia bacterium]|nr:hypothetical protein [Clostridia bacterium]
IVSNSDMIKTYKACRDKAENKGKIFILKNNQPDAVLFSITEYEKIAAFVEYLESHTVEEAEKLFMIPAAAGKTKEYSIECNPSELQ